MASSKQQETEKRPLSGLDLSQAASFEPFAAGTYAAQIANIQPTEVKNDGGKMAVGTPGINVHFRITEEYDSTGEEEIAGRFVFSNYYMPTAEQSEKYKQSQAFLVGFLVAIGEDEAEIKSGNYDLDEKLEDLIGRDCRVVVGVDEQYNSNPVKRVLPPDDGEGSDVV